MGHTTSASVCCNSRAFTFNFGKKTPEELADAARVEFNYSVTAATPEYLEIMLTAKDGPAARAAAGGAA